MTPPDPPPAAQPVAAAQPLRDERGMRLPREPYPGLRPFLDFEAALLFGRQRQVREIIERLARTQFVAVLGGSGSGKSSLIHAGVTPALRSYGIPGAGDLWLTMVCTPGTNVAAAEQTTRRHSPVARLVRRFAQLLKGRGSEAADEARLVEMAEVFRQEAGFARLLEAYGDELVVPPGPDPAEARVLFVVDQFEEVFHPTNQGVADADLLVERVLDHFFRPHPRCHVVITMRSEHLNDCARFLELPDAINKSSFLVRRLDADELREAIVGPAQRFLRLMSRSFGATPQGATLPEQVVFEPAVLERLLRDVTAITHDPDHLPLLQHMLARLWQAALEREDAMDALVPACISRADLARAVNAAAPGIDVALAEGVNTLRASVNNWPERIWQSHGPVQQQQLDTLFSRLALKDPNTGHYSQQRVEAGAAAALLGLGAGPGGLNSLRRLLGDGFLGSVDYLFWDAEDPQRVTLKVSHESFIRGWRRFKSLIDAEAAQYEEYLAVVRRCAAWADHARGAEDLLSAGELKRLRASSLQRRREAGEPFDDWLRLLALDREGARLVRHAGSLPVYLDESQRVDRRRDAWQRVLPLIMLLGVGVGLALASLFTTLVQSPSMRRAELVLDAFSQAETADVAPRYAARDTALGELRRLLDAAADIDGARTGAGTAFGRLSARLIRRLDGLGVVRRQGEFLESVLAQAEPEVNGKLRAMLNTSPLFAVPRPGVAPGDPPRRFEGECRAAAVTAPLVGRVLVAPSTRDEMGPRRALFIPGNQREGEDLLVYGASWDAAAGLCRLSDLALVLRVATRSLAVIDSSLRFVVFTVESPDIDTGSVILQEMSWRIGPAGEPSAVQRTTLVSLSDPLLLQKVREVAATDRLRVVPTWSVPAGRVIEVGGLALRVVSAQARRLRADVSGAEFRRVVAAAPGTPCQTLAATLAPVPGWRLRMLDAGSLCLAMYRTRSDRLAPEQDGPGAVDELGVWVYPYPTQAMLARLSKRPLLPIAAVSPYARVNASLPEEPGWALGVSGEFAGWLALRTREAPAALPGESAAATERDERFIGAPLTTCALWRFGRELLGESAGGPGRDAAATCQESL